MLEECQPASQPHTFLRHVSSSFSMEGDKSNHKRIVATGMPTEELQGLCFQEDFSLENYLPGAVVGDTTASSTAISEDETEPTSNNENKVESTVSSGFHTELSLQELQDLSIEANSKVSKEVTAREGRVMQRWAVDTHNARFVRLVAGCVPILNDGRILLISSNKGKGWLVPKGGWELDEKLEEGAIRECFEEAGVTGILGPKFDAFCVETKKARKRRLELEEKQRQKPETTTPESDFYSGWSVLSQLSEEDHLTADETSYTSEEALRNSSSPTATQAPVNTVSPSPEAPKTGVRVTFQISDSDRGPIQCDLNQLVPAVDVIKPDAIEDAASTSSLTHTHTCMTFFPVFVKKIHDSWPENHRIRRAFDIDGKYITLDMLIGMRNMDA